MQKESSFILKNWTLFMYLCDYMGGFNCGFLFYVVHRSNFGKSLVVKRIELYGCVCVYIDECDCGLWFWFEEIDLWFDGRYNGCGVGFGFIVI